MVAWHISRLVCSLFFFLVCFYVLVVFNMADEALIAAVQKRDALYNKESNEYSNRIFIRKQWEEIAVELTTEG